MGSDPEPEHSVWRLNADRAVVQTHASRPKPPDFLEVNGWMMRIAFEQPERAVG